VSLVRLTFVLRDAFESLSDSEGGESGSESTGQVYCEVSRGVWLDGLESCALSKTEFRLRCAEVYDVMADSYASFFHFKYQNKFT